MTWHAGDTKPALTDIAGADLTGATCAVHVQRPDGSLISRAPTVSVGYTGAWSLPWLASELNIPGIYTYELEVTAAGGVQTFGPVSFSVAPKLSNAGPAFIPPSITIIDGGTP